MELVLVGYNSFPLASLTRNWMMNFETDKQKQPGRCILQLQTNSKKCVHSNVMETKGPQMGP